MHRPYRRTAILSDPQYRMHPTIREFPSLNFYGGGLQDGPGVAAATQRPWHACPAFKPSTPMIGTGGSFAGP